MEPVRLLLITGLPASGKTTLADALVQRLGAPLLSKDMIKEPLLDVLGASDPAQSRRLSDASFAVLFSLARTLLRAGHDVVAEGNFRTGEHETALRALLAIEPGRLRVAQLLCRVDEQLRRARLAGRAHDPSRHPGHRDGELAGAVPGAGDAFLDLPGPRFVCAGESGGNDAGVLVSVERWWRGIGHP